MSQTDTLARSLHDLGLAAWFGGSLMGAFGLNGAAAQISDPTERATIATAGWKRWAPVNVLAIGAHVVGGGMIVAANRQRVATQSGVGTATAIKMAVTAAVVAATALSGFYGNKLDKAETEVTSKDPPSRPRKRPNRSPEPRRRCDRSNGRSLYSPGFSSFSPPTWVNNKDQPTSSPDCSTKPRPAEPPRSARFADHTTRQSPPPSKGFSSS